MVGRAISIACILVSGYWMQQGVFNYGFWTKDSPGGGFIPTIFGALVLVLSLFVLFRRTGEKDKKVEIELPALIPVAAAIAGVVLIQVAGITAAVFLFVAAWMKFLSKYSWIKSLLVSAVFSLFIYGVFRMWLSVPFPKGILGLG